MPRAGGATIHLRDGGRRRNPDTAGSRLDRAKTSYGYPLAAPGSGVLVFDKTREMGSIKVPAVKQRALNRAGLRRRSFSCLTPIAHRPKDLGALYDTV